MIQDFEAEERVKLIKHKLRGEAFLIDRINTSELKIKPGRTKSKLLVQVCQAKGLSSSQSNCRSVVSVEFRGELKFTGPSDNLKDPKFRDCFTFPIRLGDNKRSSISLKVLTVQGDGEFKPGANFKQVTLARANLEVMKYTNDEAVHELILLLPAIPTDPPTNSEKQPFSKGLKLSSPSKVRLEEVGTHVSEALEQGLVNDPKKIKFVTKSK